MMTPQHALSALLADKLPGYRSAFEQGCAALFGGGAAVTLEYEDDDEGAVSRPAVDVPIDVTAPVAELEVPDPERVRADIAAALRTIATDFARTFNEHLQERAQLDPVAGALAPRYAFGEEHIGELVESLGEVLKPLAARLDVRDFDGARRAAIDGWRPLERRIQEKWQAYFVLTFMDVSVEIKAERDRRRLQAPRVDIAAAEAARGQSGKLVLPDFAAPERAARRGPLSAWLLLLLLLVVAVLGGWLLARNLSAPSATSSGAPR